MAPKILIVDDEPHLLESFKRGLAKRFEIACALGPHEGLDALAGEEPYAVVVSDLAMPGMNGVKFLARVKEISPLSVRIMLTGHGDLDAAMAAVNEGNIFRFLTKPCPMETFIRTLEAGLEQYRLVTAEKELLRGTLRGSIRVLVDILNIVNPVAFSRGERVMRLMLATIEQLGLKPALKHELVGMLSQIGLVAVPQNILKKKFTGAPLSPEEEQVYAIHSSVAAKLLGNIPRLEEVVQIIGCQEGCVPPPGSGVPLESRILSMCLEFDDLALAGITKEKAIQALRDPEAGHEPHLLRAFEKAVFEDMGYVPRTLPFEAMRPGMILSQDLKGRRGMLLLARGQEISEAALEKLAALRGSHGLPPSIAVLVPLAPAQG